MHQPGKHMRKGNIYNRIRRLRREKRVRAKVRGTSERPRLSVFRSQKYVWAQLIDDSIGKTLVSVTDKGIASKKKASTSSEKITRRRALAELVGAALAKKAVEGGIEHVVFDRGGYAYHGIVRSVAEGARKGGLQF